MKKKFVLIVLLFSVVHSFAQQPASFTIEGAYPALYFNHTVVQGQHFLNLAKLYNLSPNVIASFNGLRLGDNLPAGQAIKIPATATNFQHSQSGSSFNNYIAAVHVVIESETIGSLAGRFGLSDSLIVNSNSFVNRNIKPGDRLIIGYLKVRKEQSPVLNTSAKADTLKPSTGNSSVAIIPGEDAVADDKDVNSDELFKQARQFAFDKKDYVTALRLSYRALQKSPDYSDIRVFAGRIYTWTDRTDSAIAQFNYVIEHEADNKEVYVAYSDLLYWNDRYSEASEICEKGLSYYPASKDLLIRKVKILKALKRPAEAQKELEKLLKADPSNTEARALIGRTKDEILRNKIGVSYDYTYFDKQFDDPWHIASLDYSRQTKIGSVGGHVWYANRFRSGGVQYELEAYPHISKYFYSYVSAAYSGNVGVFPKYRSGFSLYSILPKSFEGEIGLRYLYFSDATFIYTAALSKYYKNWLFTARTYITPGESNISQSYNLVARYYYGGTDDYFALTLGRGISPDDRPVAILLNEKQYLNLVTLKAGVSYKHEFKKKYVLSLDAGWMNQEYRPETKGNQFSSGISYQVRF